MTVSFLEIPSDLRVPGVFVEFDSSRASQVSGSQPFQGLVVGQRTSGGSVAELVPKVATSADQVAQFFGDGSQIHGMAQRWFENNRATPTTFVALDDDGGGADATGTLTVGGSPTEDGTLFLYVAGRRLQIAVSDTDTPTTIADAVTAAVTADDFLPVTAGNVAGVVTFTAKNAGEGGNGIDLRLNYFEGEELPDGVTGAVVAMAGGTGNPVVTTVWPVIAGEHWNAIAWPFTDATSLSALETELERRWGPMVAREGFAVAGARGTLAGLLAVGAGRNSKHYGIVGADESPHPPYEWAAAVAAIVAREGAQDPARPFQTLEIEGVLPPASEKVFVVEEDDQLLKSGISTFTVGSGGEVRIGSLITTWQTNAAGAPDISFLYANVVLTLGFLRWDLRTRIASTYGRHKLAGDETQFDAGQAIVTPRIMRGHVVGIFRAWEGRGLVEGFDQFRDDLLIERNGSNPERLDIRMAPDLVNGLRVVGVQLQFLI